MFLNPLLLSPTCRLVPRLPPFFVLQFAFGIKHGNGRVAKNGESIFWNTYHMNDVRWTWEGLVPDYKYVRMKEFLTSQRNVCNLVNIWSLAKRQSTRCRSLVHYCNADPSPPRPPHFSPLFHFHVLYSQTKDQKRGRPGNEANLHAYNVHLLMFY